MSVEDEIRIKHKTRGNTSAQGKQRVFFCCHPADYERYFKSISDEILKKQNCAIYYYELKTVVSDEERALDLAQMQLFVMPITTKLLTEDSVAMKDFAFAVKHKIPVLPLMQERGLEKLYSTKIGNLQFLDKHANERDVTAISYDEKLGKYLSSVLVSDETAEKVRAAFDAYIFLSYRKKDRKYAQELMRLIHKNEFCRDIAIWYDEFLTPGKDFNDMIKSALDKSELFMLNVTPSLLEKGNYIVDKEFPLAKESGKNILPAETVKTDREQLKKMYADIPAVIDSNDDEKLSQALLNALKNIAKRENDGDPEHNFFIGLAYLNGIDVEKDGERALSLITSAAESGLPEAMEKLIAMYRDGDGVKRDYKKALEWQEKLCDCYREIFNKDKSEENATKLYDSLMYLGDNYLYGGKDYKAWEIYSEMKDVAEFTGDKSRRNVAICYGKLGDATHSVCANFSGVNLSAVRDDYIKSHEIFKSIADETGTIEARKDLASSYWKIGWFFEGCGKKYKKLVKDCYRESRKILKSIAKESGPTEYKIYLAERYQSLGEAAEDVADKENIAYFIAISLVRLFYRKSLKIRKAIAEETGSEDDWNEVANCYENLAFAEKWNSPKRDVYQRKAREIFESTTKMTNDISNRQQLSLCYCRCAHRAESNGNISEAKDYYFKSAEILKSIVEETEGMGFYDVLADVLYQLGRLLKDKEMLQKAADTWNSLANGCKDSPSEAAHFTERRDIALQAIKQLTEE